ncbi:hypothetical protein [Micromonospora sp. RV43]|uniref:hypothetical protein n=1 Tax=Micromonospora sp. RV43 TaxID=1661387 RepID=UPI000AC09C05|nr:hypothetical protein [Micromonospora sp. RV43]
MRHKRAALAAAIVAAVTAVTTGAAWAAADPSPPNWNMMGGHSGPGMMSGASMMGGSYGLAGDGQRVESLDQARQRGAAFADRLGLRVGETMQFANGYYAELTTEAGRGATEVLIDPGSGGVSVEYGPAMMWNTGYGMHARATTGAARVSAAEATTIAQRWLDRQGRGLVAGEADEFPGYYTLHTLRDGRPVGMMSVNAYTGAVWDHTWHGTFVTMSEE